MDINRIKSLSISANTTIKEALQSLDTSAGQILFVVDDRSSLLGTITDGDLRRGIIHGIKFSDNIDSVMSRKFISLSIAEPDLMGKAKELMLSTKVEQIPILDGSGIITDVITWTDILGAKLEETVKQKHENLVVIMAGGKGTRMDPFTKILPKPLVPVGDKPAIEVIMESFYKSGFYKFSYTLNYKKEFIKLFLKENQYPYAIDWVDEEQFMGTAGSLSLLKGKINDTFFVANCDSLLNVDFEEVLHWHKEHKAVLTILGSHNEIRIPFGVFEMSEGKLDRMLEKPTHDIVINTGVYVMEPRVLSYVQDGKYLDMNTLIDKVTEKEKVTVYPVYNAWFDIGQWEEYKKSIEQLKNKKPDEKRY
jgi:dTDP-glucose pyrophosphorylase